MLGYVPCPLMIQITVPKCSKPSPQLHDIDSTGLWLRACRCRGSDLEYGAYDVSCGVGHVGHHALRQVKGSVAVGSSKRIHLLNRLHGGQRTSRDESLPSGAYETCFHQNIPQWAKVDRESDPLNRFEKGLLLICTVFLRASVSMRNS